MPCFVAGLAENPIDNGLLGLLCACYPGRVGADIVFLPDLAAVAGQCRRGAGKFCR